MRRWDRGRNVDCGPGTSSVETTMYQYRVDPIRYGWERCNRSRVSLPAVVGRGPGQSPSVSSPSANAQSARE